MTTPTSEFGCRPSIETSADSPDDRTRPCSACVFVESSDVSALAISAVTSPTLTVTAPSVTVVSDLTSTPPTDARTSPFGTAVVVVAALLTDELLDEPTDDESSESASVVLVFPDLGEEDDVVVGSTVIDDGDVVLVVSATVVVVVVVVVGGAFEVTMVRDPDTMFPAIPPEYVTTYSVLAVRPETFAKNSVGQTGLLLLLRKRPLDVPLPEPTETPSFETVHVAVTVNGEVLPVLFRQPLICI